MAQTTRKLNFMIDNDVAAELEKYVPSGRRSKVVTQAIARELALQRRKRISERLLELRSKTTKMTGRKLLSELAEDRKRR
jgi:hypothetical protein